MKKSVRNALIVALVVIGAASILYTKLQPMKVETYTMAERDLYDYLEETGKVVTGNESLITPKASGQVTAVNVRSGDVVEKGTLLVSLDSEALLKQIEGIQAQIKAYEEQKSLSLTQLKSQVSNLNIQLKDAEQKKDFANEQFENMTSLYEQGSLSETEWKSAKQTYETAESTYNQLAASLNSANTQYKETLNADGTLQSLNSQLDTLEIQLRDCEIRALSDGIVAEFDVKVGAVVSPQQSIGKVVEDGSYQIEAFVLTEDAINIHLGDKASLILKQNGVDRTFDGEIIKVGKVAEEKVSSLGLVEQRIKVNLKSTELDSEVSAGYEVKVKFITESKMQALPIAKTSVMKREDKSYVFVLESGKAMLREIETGMDTDSEIDVISGLKAGDIIIKNYKLDGLEEGVRAVSKESL